MFGFQIFDDQLNIENHFQVRHLLAHKNRRTKNGEYLKIYREDLSELLIDCQNFVNQISGEIKQI